ncbi:hypothetical protein GFB56_14115 [Ensifer sp. T173]|jgi:hypothetical protein|uniref:Transmembrane protein n=1 Tax=Ensifer canadensis TaxID=555315 RepID=A0AAW4FLV1_9HYPH|nr:hypothetical protein [Ensifer canadensis]MBM3091948.1 hypothetical protein [Ensifer canadensis]UBI78032.1 hypothetical protein J3R84_26260 [Ensifer canadensis]
MVVSKRAFRPCGPLVLLAVLGLALAGCTTPDLEPIPGSITYGGQPRTKLTKAPVGSMVPHTFVSGSSFVKETYVIQPDRSLRLVRRDYFDIPVN